MSRLVTIKKRISGYVRHVGGKRQVIDPYIRRVHVKVRRGLGTRRGKAAALILGAAGVGGAYGVYRYGGTIKEKAGRARERAREKASKARERIRGHERKIAAAILAAAGAGGFYLLWRDRHGKMLMRRAGLSGRDIQTLKKSRALRRAIKKRARKYKRQGYNSDTAMIKALRDYRRLLFKQRVSPRKRHELLERYVFSRRGEKFMEREVLPEIESRVAGVGVRTLGR